MCAFDEIVSLGYRESVSLNQVKDIIKMDSQEENLQEIIRKNKEEHAQMHAMTRATEIALSRAKNGGQYTSGISSGDSSRGGRPGDNVYIPTQSSQGSGGKYSGISSASSSRGGSDSPVPISTGSSTPSSTGDKKNVKQQARPSNLGQMILNRPNKKKQGSSLLNDLTATGDISAQAREQVEPQAGSAKHEILSVAEQQKKAKREDIHTEVKETLQVEMNRDGGLNSLDVKGEMFLHIAENANGFIKVRLANDLKDGFVSKTHPNIDKKQFTDEHCLALKKSDKPFPTGNPLKILTWRSQGNFDETILPFTVNCWPNPSAGETSISVEYNLQDTSVELHNVVITVPIPSSNVSVENSDVGTYKIDQKNSAFVWSFDLIDSSCASGSIEFIVRERADEATFFPVDVTFTTESLISGVEINDVLSVNDDSQQRHSVERSLTVTEYKIV